MTSSQYGSYIWGCTRATMAGTEGSQTERLSGSQKAGPSSDWMSATRLHEVGIASKGVSATTP